MEILTSNTRPLLRDCSPMRSRVVDGQCTRKGILVDNVPPGGHHLNLARGRRVRNNGDDLGGRYCAKNGWYAIEGNAGCVSQVCAENRHAHSSTTGCWYGLNERTKPPR